ncbi:MAG: hypothetical protein ACYTG7_16060 [Planctomycetota bacterium]|jgi:hypothetical protein
MMLVFALVVTLLVAAVSGTLMTVTTAGAKREECREFKFKSREIAEAALGMSLNAMRQASDGVDNDGDGDVDEGMTDPSLFAQATMLTLEGNLGRIGTLNWSLANDANGNGLPDFGEQNVNPVNMSGGQVFSYSVFSENDGVDNDTDGSTDEADESGDVSIVAMGNFDNYTTNVRYSGIFTETLSPPNPPTWSPNEAFVSGGDLTVDGNADITGVNGSIHSNKYLDLGGSSIIAGDATSCNGGNIDPDCVGGTVDTAAPTVDIPDINLTTMQGLRDQAKADGKAVYELMANGKIYKDGGVVSPGGEYHGWSMTGGEWVLSSTKADLDGMFYVSGDVILTGGKEGISMTVLAEGNVDMSGNGDFTSYYENLFLVSLHDIKLSGTPQQTGDLGIVLAREQVETVGNVFIRGTILAADLDNASNYVESTIVASDIIEKSLITGNFDIEYNGNYTTSLPVYDPLANRFKLDPSFAAYEER